MSESAVPSVSATGVGSRFVSSNDIEAAKIRRDEQWRAAYARLGQEPPPQPAEDAFDGRSLAEKLAANKAAKQEEWEEKTKLANQFRALEEDEIMFLDSIRERQEQEERQRKEIDGEEVKGFKEAVAARVISAPPPTASAPKASSAAKPPAPAKKDAKKSLKGVIVKKKPKPASAIDSAPKAPEKRKAADTDDSATPRSEGPPPEAKRQKVSDSS